MTDFLVDANVLIIVLRGDQDQASYIETLDFAIDTTVYVELIQGAKNKREVSRIEEVLKPIRLIHFDEAISKRTIALIRSYSKSHGLMFGDAVIAATCLENKLELLTFNLKHFRFIEGLEVSVPKL